MFRILKVIVSIVVIVLLIGWAALAIWIDGPHNRTLAGILAALPPIGALAAAVFVRPWRRAAVTALTLFLVVALWWSSIQPRNDRDWMTDVDRPATATFDGDLVTIRNVRNFDYRTETDFTERWEERTYDLSKVRGFDMFLSYWGSPMIAHTIASWEFEDGEPLAISIETRKEKGESYSAVLGFFRQYELYYVVADERDVVRLRTNYRGEDVYLYRLRMPVQRARALLVDYLEEVNRLAVRPRWYNALTHNCTTTIRRHAQHVAPRNPFNWRILVNGYLDELGYMRGSVDTSMPFPELRRRSDVTERAKAADTAADFSERIRVGLPQPPERAR
jgi:hypothetical protein